MKTYFNETLTSLVGDEDEKEIQLLQLKEYMTIKIFEAFINSRDNGKANSIRIKTDYNVQYVYIEGELDESYVKWC